MSQVYRAIVIDDEPAARRLMKSLLQEYAGLVQVVAEAGTGEEAISQIEALQPNLIFLDIQMPDLTGFEVIERLNHKPNIIFTTAYEQYAIRAFETFSIDYLLKPISFERFLKAALKAKEYYEIREKNTAEIPAADSNYFFIKADNKLVKLFFDEVLFAEALQNYVVIHTKDKKYITYLTFKAVEDYLPVGQFIKTHKSYIIAASKIDSIEGNDIRIGQHHIPISRNLKEEVMEKLVNNRFLKR